MINSSIIDPNKLLQIILDNCCGNVNKWWDLVEIVIDYMPPYSQPDTKPTKCSIKCKDVFLRDLGHGYFVWDFHYGEDSEFWTPEQALLALMKAPVPPCLLSKELWEKTPTSEGGK